MVSPHAFYEALEYEAQIHSFPLPHGISITEIMKTWTENAGYPLITVSRDAKNNAITIQQVSQDAKNFPSKRTHLFFTRLYQGKV